MSQPGAGIKGGYIQFAPETYYGTPVAATRRLEYINGDFPLEIIDLPDEGLWGQVSERDSDQGGLHVKFKFLAAFNYEGWLEILRGISGAYSHTTVESGVEDHFFREGQVLKSYCIEAVEGDVPTGKCQVLVGAKFLTCAIRGAMGTGSDAVTMMEVTGVARDKSPNNTPTGALSYPARLRAPWVHLVSLNDGIADTVPGVTAYNQLSTVVAGPTVVQVGGADFTKAVKPGMVIRVPNINGTRKVLTVDTSSSLTLDANAGFLNSNVPGIIESLQRVKNFEVMLDNPHDIARWNGGLLGFDEPVRNGQLKATIKLVQEFSTMDQFNAARGYTTGSPSIMFQHPTQIGAASRREFEIRLRNAKLVGFTNPVPGPQVVTSTATWKGRYDPTDLTALYLRVRNTEVALT
jgi:hypothetical protein